MNIVKKTIFMGMYATAMHALTFIKLSFILGSKLAFFSLNQCLTPVLGFFAGTQSAIAVFCLRTCVSFCITGLGITYHLPTLFGTLYLTTASRILKIGIPLLCIILFLVHPVGLASGWYIIYWIPPLLLGFTSARSVFLQSLASTLTTHAVGSVFWLYSHPTDTLFWHSLHSVVWIERFLFASCMTAAYYGIVYARGLLIRTTVLLTKHEVQS